MSQSRSPSELDHYQELALLTAKYSDNARVLIAGGESVALYPFLKLAGEAGEVADKMGKCIRDDDAIVSAGRRRELMLELGDVLWYVAACSRELGYSLSHVAMQNLAKLQDRANRNALGGSGDTR